MFRDAKVGDRVWSITEGWGAITRIDDDSWPIVVAGMSYTFDGKEYPEDLNPTLFWDEVKIEPPPKPKRMAKVVKKGWVGFSFGRGTFFVRGIGYSPTIYDTQGEAEESLFQTRAVYVNLEYEVEE